MDLNQLHATAATITGAKSPEEVFGIPCASLAVAYRRLAAVVHPDRFFADAAAHKLALDSFTKLGQLRAEAEERQRLGIYGTKQALPAAPPPFVPIDIKVGGRQFRVKRLRCQGEVCDIYDGSFSGTRRGEDCVIKIAQHPSDNDIVQNEERVLTPLLKKAAGYPKHARYLPAFCSSFALRNPATKSVRRANALPLYAEHVSLADVITACPNHIDFRDSAWMLKRMLEGLGFVHRQGVVHGAVLPEHVMVHPSEHGAKLIGWGAGCELGKDRVRLVSRDYRHWYPPEVFAKQPATPALDIFMWARVGLALVGHVAPPPRFVSFLTGCLMPSVSRRPTDAWALRDELSDLLQKLVGPPTYREFHMPKVVT